MPQTSHLIKDVALGVPLTPLGGVSTTGKQKRADPAQPGRRYGTTFGLAWAPI